MSITDEPTKMRRRIKRGEPMDDTLEATSEGTGKVPEYPSITEELRECIRTANRSYEDARNPYNDREILHIVEEELLKIADRIDERYHRDMATAQQVGYNEGEDAAMRDGWVKLPVDADGFPIHVGDVVRMELMSGGESKPLVVDRMELSRGKDGDLWCVALDTDKECWNQPSLLHHHQPDSWIRIIGDAMSFDGDGWYSTRDDAMAELVERCRRLAGEAE